MMIIYITVVSVLIDQESISTDFLLFLSTQGWKLYSNPESILYWKYSFVANMGE